MFQPSIFWGTCSFSEGNNQFTITFFVDLRLVEGLNFWVPQLLPRFKMSRKTVEKNPPPPGMSGKNSGRFGILRRGHRCDPIIGMVYDGFLDGIHGTVYFVKQKMDPNKKSTIHVGKWHTDIPDPYGSIYGSYGQYIYILEFGDEQFKSN